MLGELLQDLAVPVVSGLIGGLVANWIGWLRFRREYQFRDSAERAARALLNHKSYELRSFKEIKRRLGGFDDDRLRQILVGAGAVQFWKQDGAELWGLIERNKERLGQGSTDKVQKA